jgi:tRNA A37 threonylcarbamoyladenosine dehydratase
MENLKSKRFVVRKSLIGKNQIIEVTFSSGKIAKYNHDDAYEAMKEKLEKMNCWEKYKSYTSSSSIPVSVRSVLITD